MKRTIIVFIASLFCVQGFCQTLTTRLIFTENNDSLLSPKRWIKRFFDEKGNYCFEYFENGSTCFQTNKRKIAFKAGFEFSTGEVRCSSIRPSDSDGGIRHYYRFDDGSVLYCSIVSDEGIRYYSIENEEVPYYYKNQRGAEVFGPVIGKIGGSTSSGTREHVAISFQNKDTISYYVNDSLVAKKYLHEGEIGLSYFGCEWCAFSENGNTIYFIEKGKLYYLYVNGKVIDKSENKFKDLAINNNGKYVYLKDMELNPFDSRHSFFIHNNDSIVGPVEEYGYSCLTQNNGFYYSKPAHDSTKSIVVNNHLEKGVDDIKKVILCDAENYLYEDRKANGVNVNVNGKQYSYSFSEVLFPNLNRNGEFAFYGIQNYNLYKFINGKKVETPIKKYGVRATPLYISPQGESLHYFKTDDSIYLYRDDSLVLKPSSKSNFKLRSYRYEKNGNYPSLYEGPQNGNSLFYLEYDTSAYWVYNGTFSKPMHIVEKNHVENEDEDNNSETTIIQHFNDNGFFVIQKIGKSKYLINVNNRIYQEVEDVDIDRDRDNYFFNEQGLVFYGVKGQSVYQFRLSM